MWIGKLHEVEFIDKMLHHVVANRDSFGTSTRIEGMLTVARSVCLNSNRDKKQKLMN